MVSGYRKKHLPTVRRIPDEVWDEVRRILPPEKPSNTKGRPPVSYRKVLDGILYVKNRVSMEDVIQGLLLWFYMS